MCLFTCLRTHVVSPSATYKKKKRPPPSLGIMGLETIEGSHVAFQGEETGPPSPLIGGEVEWHLYYARRKIHNGAAAQCRGALHSLFFFFSSVTPFFREWVGGGSMRRQLSPGEDRGVMWESSARSRTPAEASTCASVLSLLGVFFVFSQTQRG